MFNFNDIEDIVNPNEEVRDLHSKFNQVSLGYEDMLDHVHNYPDATEAENLILDSWFRVANIIEIKANELYDFADINKEHKSRVLRFKSKEFQDILNFNNTEVHRLKSELKQIQSDDILDNTATLKFKAIVEDKENEIGVFQLDYWKQFDIYAFNEGMLSNYFNRFHPHAKNWYDLKFGNKNIHVFCTVLKSKNKICCGIYVHDNKQLFEIYKKNKDEFERILGFNCETSEGSKDARIVISKDVDLNCFDNWKEYFKWQCECAIKLKNIAETMVLRNK